MFGTSPFLSKKDKRVKVYADNTAVSASLAQSEYARYLNFIGNRFTAVSNTVGGVKTYDIALKYADKIIPYEAGVAKGSTPGYLNFDGNHFDVSSLASSMYTVTSTGRMIPYEGGVAKSATLGFLNFDNTHFDVAALASDQYTVTNPAYGEVSVFSSGVQVGTEPRRLNFTGATVTENSGNNYFTVATGVTLPDGNTTTRKYGILRGGTFDGEGYFSGLQNEYSSRTTTLTASAIYTKWLNGGTDEDLAGFQTAGFITRRAYNPYFKIKFKTDIVGEKITIGLISDTARPLSADGGTTGPIDTLSGVVLDYDDVDTTYWIHRNDGTSPGTALDTTVSNNDAGTFHTLEITLSNSGAGSVTVVLDGVTKVNAATTNIPAATTDLCLFASTESAGGSNVDFTVEYCYLLQDV